MDLGPSESKVEEERIGSMGIMLFAGARGGREFLADGWVRGGGGGRGKKEQGAVPTQKQGLWLVDLVTLQDEQFRP